MNICFFGAIDPNGCGCGVSRVTLILRDLFQQHGHVVYILTPKYQEAKDEKSSNDFVRLPQKDVLVSPENIAFLNQFCTDKKIDLIINQENGEKLQETFGALRSQGVKVFSCIHCVPSVSLTNVRDRLEGRLVGMGPFGRFFAQLTNPLRSRLKYQSTLPKLRRKMMNILSHSDCVVLLQEGLKADFMNILQEDNPQVVQKLRAIPNPCPVAKQVGSSSAPRKKQLLWVGRLKYRAKRPDRMLYIWERLCSQYPEWELLFLGTGNAMDDMKSYVKRKKLPRVRFCGQVNTEDFYSQAEILCSTSTAEGFHMVLTEALSYGVIPVAFNAFPSAQEIIHHGQNGLLVTPFSLTDYCEKLSSLMKDDAEKKRQELRSASQTTLDKFTPEAIYALWERLFNDF